MIDDVARKGFASTTIEGCLHLMAVKGGQPVQRHSLIPMFHLLSNPDFFERHLTPEEVLSEVHAFNRRARIVDLVALSMKVACGRSIFYWSMPRTQQVNLAMGHIRLIGYFDIDAFLKYLETAGIKVSWVTGKEADKMREFSSRIPGSPNAYGLKVELPNGSIHQLMIGFFSRVFLYLTKPSSLLEMIQRMDEQEKKMAALHSRKTLESEEA